MELFFDNVNYVIDPEKVAETIAELHEMFERLKAIVYSEGLEFISNGDGTCQISRLGTCTDTDIVIPKISPEGDRVTSIGQGAFEYCDNLTSITIPDSVISIGSNAFRDCNSLTNFIIPDNVTSIGDYAFYYCRGLASITFTGNSKLVSISPSMFESCGSLTSIIIPDSVTSIGSQAFSWDSSLKSITIPEGVTSIGSYAFIGCTGLKNIIFNGTVAKWNEIPKGENWNKDVPATQVQCSDGVVTL